MKRKLELLSDRKKVLRELALAKKSEDIDKMQQLQKKADDLLEEASMENETLTTEESYGLMAY